MLGIAESVIGVAGKVLDKFVEDKDLKTKLEAELKTQMVSLDLAQAQANIEQAKTSFHLCSREQTSYHVDMCLCSWLAVYLCPYYILGIGDLVSNSRTT